SSKARWTFGSSTHGSSRKGLSLESLSEGLSARFPAIGKRAAFMCRQRGHRTYRLLQSYASHQYPWEDLSSSTRALGLKCVTSTKLPTPTRDSQAAHLE